VTLGGEDAELVGALECFRGEEGRARAAGRSRAASLDGGVVLVVGEDEGDVDADTAGDVLQGRYEGLDDLAVALVQTAGAGASEGYADEPRRPSLGLAGGFGARSTAWTMPAATHWSSRCQASVRTSET
jgi:hypothetical protein